HCLRRMLWYAIFVRRKLAHMYRSNADFRAQAKTEDLPKLDRLADHIDAQCDQDEAQLEALEAMGWDAPTRTS
ncbi:MAG: hypothetical protein ACYC5O_00645, partial [Anaerolineae bacterium]